MTAVFQPVRSPMRTPVYGPTTGKFGSDLKFSQDFLLNSSSTIASVKRKGPILDFSRAGNAGDFDSNGFWAFAPHNYPLHSEGLDEANWAKGSSVTVTVDQSPDLPSGVSFGSAAADRVTIASGGSLVNSRLEQPAAISGGTNSKQFTASCYARTLTGTAQFRIDCTHSAVQANKSSNLTATTAWQRFEFSVTNGAADGDGNQFCGINDSTGFDGADLYVIGLQLNAGLSALRYVPTTTGTVFDQPVFAHDPADSNAQLGMGMWEARTQLGKKVSDLSDAVWTTLAVNADVPSSVEDDIFGTSLGSELACTATADQAVSLAQAYTGLTANATTAVAAYVKTGVNASFVQLAWESDGSGADGCFCNFELTGAGTVGTPTALAAGSVVAAATQIELTTDGFYRCTLVGDIDVGTVGRYTISIVDEIGATVFQAANLTDNDSLIVNAIDVQVGGFMTTHIPNPSDTATVTRATDVPPTTTDVSGVNSSNLSIFAQAIIPTVSAQERSLFTIDDGGTTDVIRLYMDATENVNFETVNSGGTDGASDGAAVIAVDTVFKGMGTAEDDSVIGYVDGTASAEDTSAAIPVTDAATTIRIGGNSGATVLNGYMQAARMWDVTKSAAFAGTETT